jgi:hypothetical protein
VVADDDGDDKRHRGVEPEPAAGDQDDRAGGRDADCRGGVGDGVKQDRRDRQITPVISVVIVGVSPEHEGADGHDQSSYAAHHQHRQAVHLRGTGDEPRHGRGGHEHLKDKQPSAVDQCGEVRRVRAAGPPDPAGGAGRHADGEQCHRHRGGVQHVVAPFGEDGERMCRQADGHQADDKTKIQDENNRQALGARHVR